jgi:hypothetical protein
MPVPTGFSPANTQKAHKIALGPPKTPSMREIFTHHA